MVALSTFEAERSSVRTGSIGKMFWGTSRRAFLAHNKTVKFPNYADTRHMAGKLVSKGLLKSASMDNLCEHYNVKFSGRAHTALADCQRTISVWLKLLDETEMEFFSYENPYDKR